MSPNIDNLAIADEVEDHYAKPTKAGPWKFRLVYKAVFSMIYSHIAAVYALYLLFTSAKKETILFGLIVYILAGIGVTAGSHRLWSHRSFKAKMPLQIMLMLFQSMAFQLTVMTWVKRHRLHHKHSDTDADPHNASRGFFFSHMGWIMVYGHDEMKKRLKLIDLSDVTSNPVLMFQKKYGLVVISTMCFVLPTVLPMVLWGETLNNAWHINLLRYVLNLNATFLINSAAHKYGSKPYNSQILPSQNNFVSLVICGEGFHNYHHTFPWDYRAAELGNNVLNISSLFIDLCARIGWAYDLKTVNEEMIKARAAKTGDGTDSWGMPKTTE